MTPVRFPRYIARDPRDYFYLTRKPRLPGAGIVLGGKSLAFDTRVYPGGGGFPHPFARAMADDGTQVIRIDATRAVPRPLAAPSLVQRIARLEGISSTGGASQVALHARYQHGHLRMDIGRAPGGSRTLLTGPLFDESSMSSNVVGVDTEGFLVFVKASTPAAAREALRAAGAAKAIALGAAQLEFQQAAPQLDAGAGQLPEPDNATQLSFMAENRPAAEVIFGDVKPMPYRRWGWLQDQRVRYFPNHDAREARFPTPEDVR
jgi:hypothetical protein